MKHNSPCRECNDRYPACHAKCECYLTWRAEFDADKEKECAYKRAHGQVTAVEHDARMRYARRDKLRKKVGQR